MPTRNTDCSNLTERIRTKVVAGFSGLQKSLATPATGQPVILKTNPQSGSFSNTVITDNATGSETQYSRAFGTTLIDSACGCCNTAYAPVPVAAVQNHSC